MLQQVTAPIVLLTTFALTTLITPVCIKIIKKLGLFDDPKRHKHPAIIHTKPVPRGGGIPLLLGIIISGILFLPITPITTALFVASFLALAIGIFDDKLNTQGKDVSPYLRFLVNVLCALIVAASGISIRFITNPFGGILHLDTIAIPLLVGGYSILFSDIVTVLWIVWVMNMLNWSKGVDGQMPGIVAISSIVIGIVSLKLSTNPITLIESTLSFIIAGSCLGFLIYNFYPARIFPGYGATSVYLLLSVVAILSSAKLATAILVMGIPIIDGVFTIVRRIISGRSPFTNDKKHLHHLLLALGLTQRQIALFYWSISAILGLISLQLQSKSKLFAIAMLVVVVGGTIFFLHLSLKGKNDKDLL